MDQTFEIYLRLKPGKYEYKFCIDHKNWWYDMEYPTTIDSKGNINNVLYITDDIITHREGIPTSFVWSYNPKAVSCEIYGEWDDWESHAMKLCNGDWIILLEIPEGKYQYKYCIDHSDWCYDMAEPVEKDECENINNIRIVKSIQNKNIFSISDSFEQEAKNQALKIHHFESEESSESETESSDSNYHSAEEDDPIKEREKELKKKEEIQKQKEDELRKKEERLIELERRVLDAMKSEKAAQSSVLSPITEVSAQSKIPISGLIQSVGNPGPLTPRGIGRSAAPTPRSSRVNIFRSNTETDAKKKPHPQFSERKHF